MNLFKIRGHHIKQSNAILPARIKQDSTVGLLRDRANGSNCQFIGITHPPLPPAERLRARLRAPRRMFAVRAARVLAAVTPVARSIAFLTGKENLMVNVIRRNNPTKRENKILVILNRVAVIVLIVVNFNAQAFNDGAFSIFLVANKELNLFYRLKIGGVAIFIKLAYFF